MEPDILRIPIEPGQLHVERFGHGGEAVVLLHGFPTCSFLWRHVAPEIALRGSTAFAIDLLGYGESDRPFDADFGVTAQAEYLDQAFTALRISKAAVIGVDFGAAVALRLAATRPERVTRLVLFNPPDMNRFPGPEVGELQRNTARFALRVSQGVLGAAPLLTPLLQGSVSDPQHMPERLVARYLAPFVGREGVRHLLNLSRSMRQDDLEQIELNALSVPTLIVFGEGDRWLDGKSVDRMAAQLGNARLVRLPSVGRLAPEEAPERVLELIRAVPRIPQGEEGILPARREPVG